jgi:transposase
MHSCHTPSLNIQINSMSTTKNSAYHPSEQSPVLGIDVSKETLDACFIQLDGTTESLQVSNTAKGIQRLIAWVTKRVDRCYVCLEATSIYGKQVAEYAHAVGLPVSVINPRQTHAYAKSQLARTKNDAIDARLIARFARAMLLEGRLPCFEPLSTSMQALQALVRYREALVTQRVQVLNRLETTELTWIQRSEKAILQLLDRQIEKVEAQIMQQIEADPAIKESFEILTSITGIGSVTATVLLAELPPIERFDSPKQVAATAGVTPRARHSGARTPSSQPISKMGNARIRKTLYMAALSAMKYNVSIKSFAARLFAKGKPGKVVVVAVMRKLIHISFALLKRQARYQPDHINLKPATN